MTVESAQVDRSDGTRKGDREGEADRQADGETSAANHPSEFDVPPEN